MATGIRKFLWRELSKLPEFHVYIDVEIAQQATGLRAGHAQRSVFRWLPPDITLFDPVHEATVMKNWILWFCIVLLALPSAPPAHASGLTFTFAKANIPGAYLTEPVGINNTGAVIGTFWDFQLNIHAFLKDGGKITELEPPAALPSSTAPLGLNLNGSVSVVGYYINSLGGLVGFLYENGTFTDVTGPSGSVGSIAAGINDNGSIVGGYIDIDGVVHGFLLENGVYTTLDVPGAVLTVAYGINDGGGIVLNSQDSNGNSSPSLYNGGTYTTINVPYAAVTNVIGINSSGDISYTWFDAIGVAHGALRHKGKYYRFDYPTYTGTWARGLNDKGKIIGYVQSQTGAPDFGFKATYKH